MKHCLTIAGSDCSGGAGIQADLKTFAAHGAFGMSVITSVVAENTVRVLSALDVPAQTVREQMDAVFEDIRVDAVKLGMLPSAAVMDAVADKLVQYGVRRAVVDPVMLAKGGGVLMRAEALDAMRRKIVPLSYVLTPNLPEAEALTGLKIEDEAGMAAAARALHAMGAKNVLVKGGHLMGEACDLLFDGTSFTRYAAARIDSKNTHGTGCTLSSAIAARLARGDALPQAVAAAKEYVTEAIRRAPSIGHGFGPMDHFFAWTEEEGL